MSAEPAGTGFSPRTVLALVLVGVVSFAGFAVLAAFAPDLRGGMDRGAHALSRSAIGFRGAVVMQKALGEPVSISRSRPSARRMSVAGVVLTPTRATPSAALAPFLRAQRVLIVLPKWAAATDLEHPGFVRKLAAVGAGPEAGELLKPLAASVQLSLRKGVSRPVLRGAGGPFAAGTYLPLGPVDQLQTLAGDGWGPALVDETGAMVLAYSRSHPNVLVLADPDLLDTQGLANLDTARAGMAILEVTRAGDGPLLFDVTLDGLEQGHGIGRTLLQPPWLSATLCGVAAALLLGAHALARFGPLGVRPRAFALGVRALVDNSAGLVRLARKEHELAPAYLALETALIGRAAGPGHKLAGAEEWLAELARRRGLSAPDALAAEAADVRGRDAALAFARKVHEWRLEMTRER